MSGGIELEDAGTWYPARGWLTQDEFFGWLKVAIRRGRHDAGAGMDDF